jgi:hypothetical protein
MDLDGSTLDLDLDVLLGFDSVLEGLGLDSDSLSEELLLLLLLSFWFLDVDFCFEEDSSSVLSFFLCFLRLVFNLDLDFDLDLEESSLSSEPESVLQTRVYPPAQSTPDRHLRRVSQNGSLLKDDPAP